jgi:hypothetical protein
MEDSKICVMDRIPAETATAARLLLTAKIDQFHPILQRNMQNVRFLIAF